VGGKRGVSQKFRSAAPPTLKSMQFSPGALPCCVIATQTKSRQGSRQGVMRDIPVGLKCRGSAEGKARRSTSGALTYRMPKRSAGILLYQRQPAGWQCLLVHPGGPFWINKDDGAWSIPKANMRRMKTLSALRSGNSPKKPGLCQALLFPRWVKSCRLAARS
jgi:hypothetical protein